jgi:hypothetical protein
MKKENWIMGGIMLVVALVVTMVVIKHTQIKDNKLIAFGKKDK